MIDQRFVSRAAGAAATIACILLSSASVAQAQSTPQIATVSRTGGPTPPTGTWSLCTPNPNTGAPSPTCPIIQYNGYTTWAYTYVDNRVAYDLVTYDAQGNVVKNVQRDGARYPYNMTVDTAAQTVSIWGQSNAKVDVAWADLQPPAPAGPVYTWTPASAPPANVVTAPVAPSYPVCRATSDGPPGKFWVGWWDGSACNGSYGNMLRAATGNLQFLTLVSGTAQWTTPPNPGGSVPSLPANPISGGPTPSGDYNQPVCAYNGFVGWVYETLCEHNGGYPPGGTNQVLIGTLQ